MEPERPPARPEAAAERDWLTLGQAARFLGVAQSTIRTWTDLGRLPAFTTPGGHRRFRRAELERFVAGSGAGPPRPRPSALLVGAGGEQRGTLRAAFEQGGYAVDEAGSGGEALALIAVEAPALVLLDLGLPDAEGWSVLRALEQRHGAVPVVLFNGGAESARAAGAASPPVDPAELLERARKLVP
jgi:excisionase family DNA binding protein